MQYERIVQGTFISRPNRFIAKVLIEGVEHTVHVKNTGRCRELLPYGTTVFLDKASNPERKTQYDLVAVMKTYTDGRAPLLINMDSGAPNIAAYEWILSKANEKGHKVRKEVAYGDSRLDICVEEIGGAKTFIEVKGVTLECDGVAMFPDAPTERGVKHIKELVRCVQEGHKAYILFVVQMKGISEFRPNEEMHPEFAETLREAKEAGVGIIAMDCLVTKDSMIIDKPVIVEL